MPDFKQVKVTTRQPQTCAVCLKEHSRDAQVLMRFTREPVIGITAVCVCDEFCLVKLRRKFPETPGQRAENLLSRLSVRFN